MLTLREMSYSACIIAYINVTTKLIITQASTESSKEFIKKLNKKFDYKSSSSSYSAAAVGAKVHDESLSLLQFLAVVPNRVTFVSNF
jgi:hypothetical protein